jgi:hypothetical protein
LREAVKLKDHGWKCTSAVVWSVVLRAAAQMTSISAACRDLSGAPSDEAVLTALEEGLPRTLRALENQLHAALTNHVPNRVRRRRWPVAIDWHLIPYYGQPQSSRNELYYGKPCHGTTKFHAYATACIVSHGVRYTLAVTWVRRHETTVVALRRLLARIRELGLKIRRLLLDRAFFNVHPQSAPAVAVRGRGAAAPQPVGLASRATPVRGAGRRPDAAPRSVALSAHARLDSLRHHRRTPRRLTALRRTYPLRRTWNY